MPTDHRGNPVDGPHTNCRYCGEKGVHRVAESHWGPAHMMCNDCMGDAKGMEDMSNWQTDYHSRHGWDM